MEDTSSTGFPQEDDDKNLQLVGAEIVSPIFEAEGNWQATIEKVFRSLVLGARFPSRRTDQPISTYMS